MDHHLITHTHPVDGYFEIHQLDNWVSVSCKWPFDTETDEWIEIQNKFGPDEYSRAVRCALAGDRGKAEGIEGGSIIIEQSGAEQTIVEVSNIAKGWAARSLRMKIAEPVASFMVVE